jgi:DNA-directed RNA polymerase subunit RPC12/RpoP
MCDPAGAQAPEISREAGCSMSFGQGPSIGSFEPPVHCPRCGSRLMSTVSTVVCAAEVIVARRCPECGLHDSIVTTVLRAALWYRHDTRTLEGLLRLADSLRDARMLAVVEPSGAVRPSRA